MKNNLLAKEKTTKENRIWVRIAAACNEKCKFCLDSEAQDGRLIPEDEVKQKIREAFVADTYNRVILSGGEASINPKFSEYIQYAKEIGYNRVQTVTNGNMFFRKEFCDKVVNAGLDEVTFSMHGHTPELHDYLTATPGSFKRALIGIANLRKYHPHVILNIDIVVNRLNVSFLPKIVSLFLRFGIMEFDILQIIPFGRGFKEFKNELFYKIEDVLPQLHETWNLSKIPGMYIWTNRFPAEAFEGYEDLIQDPRKIKSETLGEARSEYDTFIQSHGKKKPRCFGERCDVCFLQQYCHDFLKNKDALLDGRKYIIGDRASGDISEAELVVLRGEEFPSEVYRKYGNTGEEFIEKIQSLKLTKTQEIVNVPKCIRAENNSGQYEWYGDTRVIGDAEEYTGQYIKNFYRKKSPRCKSCIHFEKCEGIHINFIRSYGFQIMKPVQKKEA